MRSIKNEIKEAMRADEQAIEDFRRRAANAGNREKYYRFALGFWRDDWLLGHRMIGYLREAAARDGVQLKDEYEA